MILFLASDSLIFRFLTRQSFSSRYALSAFMVLIRLVGWCWLVIEGYG